MKFHKVFEEPGPNGKHQCLVFELTGQTAHNLLKREPKWSMPPPGQVLSFPKVDKKCRYSRAKSMLKDALEGLHCLHKCGIVHGDLHMGNLVASLPILSSQQRHDLVQRSDPPKYVSPERLDGKLDRWVPIHLYPVEPLTEFVTDGVNVDMKIADLGAGKRGFALRTIADTDRDPYNSIRY